MEVPKQIASFVVTFLLASAAGVGVVTTDSQIFFGNTAWQVQYNLGSSSAMADVRDGIKRKLPTGQRSSLVIASTPDEVLELAHANQGKIAKDEDSGGTPAIRSGTAFGDLVIDGSAVSSENPTTIHIKDRDSGEIDLMRKEQDKRMDQGQLAYQVDVRSQIPVAGCAGPEIIAAQEHQAPELILGHSEVDFADHKEPALVLGQEFGRISI